MFASFADYDLKLFKPLIISSHGDRFQIGFQKVWHYIFAIISHRRNFFRLEYSQWEKSPKTV